MKRNENVQYIGKNDDKRQRTIPTTKRRQQIRMQRKKRLKWVSSKYIYIGILVYIYTTITHSCFIVALCDTFIVTNMLLLYTRYLWCVVLLLVFVLAISSLSHRSQFIIGNTCMCLCKRSTQMCWFLKHRKKNIFFLLFFLHFTFMFFDQST